MVKYLDKIRELEDEYKSTLEKLEGEKVKLLEARKLEVYKLIDKLNIFNIDNDLIAGAILQLKEDVIKMNKDKLAIFQEKSNNFFPKRRSKGKVRDKKQSQQ
jgi:hypothetical protein